MSLDALVTAGSPPFCLARALASSRAPHTARVFAHGPHSLGLAHNARDAAIWTTLADAWIHD
jgi:hypothetical protein